MKQIGVLIAGVITGVVVASLIATVVQDSEFFAESTLQADVATRVMALCAEDTHRPSCYDRELPKLMDEGFSMEEVFMITRQIQHQDKSYQYCHVLGHYLSQKETAKDPSRWKDVFARAPRGICSNGAIHGAFQERFNAEALPNASVEELKAELLGICESRDNWKPTGLERGSCLHALGHLTMYATGGDIDKSVALCDELVPVRGNTTSLQLCYDGAFMQIFQPLEPEDEALVAHYEIETHQEAKEFCLQYEDEQFGTCTSESWALSEDIRNPEKIMDICAPLFSTGGYQLERCIDNVFYIAATQLSLDIERIGNFCNAVVDPHHHKCFNSATTRLIEVDWGNIQKSIDLCNLPSDSTAQQSCFDQLVTMSDYTFAKGSEEFTLLCNSLPESHKQQCFGKL